MMNGQYFTNGVYLQDEDYEVAKKNGISRLNLYNRYYVLHWDKERAITSLVEERPSPWKELKHLAVVSESSFHARRRAGMTPYEAATAPPDPYGREEAIVSPTHREQAKENGISKSTLEARVYRYHWPVEEACTWPIGKRRKRK